MSKLTQTRGANRNSLTFWNENVVGLTGAGDGYGSGRDRLFDPVSAVAFGFVERSVGKAQQQFGVSCGLRDRDSHTHTDLNGSEGRGDWLARNQFADLIGAAKRGGKITTGYNQQELFSAVTADAIVLAQAGGESLCDLPEDVVSSLVTELIIHLFEMIDIDQNNSERGNVTPGAGKLALHKSEDLSAIPCSGKKIMARREVQCAVR